jgi:hypothetical protein
MANFTSNRNKNNMNIDRSLEGKVSIIRKLQTLMHTLVLIKQLPILTKYEGFCTLSKSKVFLSELKR